MKQVEATKAETLKQVEAIVKQKNLNQVEAIVKQENLNQVEAMEERLVKKLSEVNDEKNKVIFYILKKIILNFIFTIF